MWYPVRCAHNPPPCRLYLLAILSSKVLFFIGWVIFFLLISEVWEINFLMFFEARALIFESRGPFGRFLEPLSDFFEKSEFTDPPKSLDFETFCEIFFNRFFWVLSFWDFWAFGCPEAPFQLSFWLLFESPGRFEKQAKVCEGCQFSRFGLFWMRLFWRLWSWVRFDTVFF